MCGSLREALNCLDADHAFLTKGDVFTDDQIEAYIELKWEEVYDWEHQPAPDRVQDVLLGHDLFRGPAERSFGSWKGPLLRALLLLEDAVRQQRGN